MTSHFDLSALATEWKARHKRAFPLSVEDAVRKAWNHPRHWVSIRPPQQGIKGIICIVKTAKSGINYWLWGYRLTTGSIVWRASRKPYE